ncbi:MAG: hypothetical protein IJ486_08020 [Firmicutes bacterium]|nr:hypothetical protein [Bacillota bacterium]
MENKTEKIDSQRNKLLNYLGWITAFVIFLFLFGSRYLESPKLKPEILSIEFYDDNQEIVLEDVLWYNSANIESILIQWEGGTPDQIQVFATPTGTDTLSETELLLTKSVLDSDYAELIDGDILKERYMAHVYFQLNFNDAIVTSDVYNIMYDENYIVE